ncbi:MAG TPA: FecR domain-containing protein [Methylomirabilota bacterium]|nr:FecR domain-containing protein [Methylomirabilota bacterium]
MRALSPVLLPMAALTSVLAVAPALAQTAPAGIVTAVHGTATIARATNNQTSPLRFKDDVFLYDRVTTGERSLARILLGGKAVVTARERSTLTITAVPGAATLDLQGGRLLLAVVKGAMRPGESIDIKTRNAIIGIRGTVVVAEFVPGQARNGSDDATVFTILRGTVEVTQIDPLAAHSVGTPLRLGALQRVKLMGTRFPEVSTISAEQAKRMTQGFAVPVRLTPETSVEVGRAHAAQVGEELTALLPPAGGAVDQTRETLLDTTSETQVVRTDSQSQSTATGTATGLLTGTTGVLTTTTGTLTGTGGLSSTTGKSSPQGSPPMHAGPGQSSPPGLVRSPLQTTDNLFKTVGAPLK